MAIRQALGTLNGPVYFTNRDGEVSLPPTDDVPTPPGWERHQATPSQKWTRSSAACRRSSDAT